MQARVGVVTSIAAILVVVAAGCLPRGEPPRGQQLVAGRDDRVILFQLGAAGAPARLLTLRSSAIPGPPNLPQGDVDVFVVSELATVAGQTRLEPLFENQVAGDMRSGGPGFEMDARGRPFFLRAVSDLPASPSDPAPLHFEKFRVDPTTGARTNYGVIEGVVERFLSVDGTLVLVGHDSVFRVLDLDDRETLLPAASSAGFVGNDVYFITPDRDLFRLRGTDLAGASGLAAHDVDTFSSIDSARGILLLLERRPAGQAAPPARTILDPATATEIPVPGATEPSFNPPSVFPSPTGRFLLVQSFSDDGAQGTTVYDRDMNTAETPPNLNGVASWRPGQDELWFQTDMDTSNSVVWRWRPGEPPVHVTDGGLATSFGISQNIFLGAPFIDYTFAGAPFTPDGEFWLSNDPDGLVSLRSIDDLASTPFALNVVGTGVSAYVPLPDGRGISEVYTTYPFHCDISLVDPSQRTSTLLASTGYVVRVGATRILALLNWVKGSLSGDLTLIDLDTGAQTLLAENVFAVAVEEPTGQRDHLPPGVRVAYLVRNRIESPYDGLWLATLP